MPPSTLPFIFQHRIEFSQEVIFPGYSISRSVEGQYFFGDGDPSGCLIWPVAEGKRKNLKVVFAMMQWHA